MRLATLASCFVLGSLAGGASAQTYTWNGGGGNGNWNAGANWTGGQPTSTAATVIQLNNTTQTTTTQNVASPFLLNQLIMQVDAGNGFVVGGNALQFAGTAPTIRNEAPALLRVTAPVTFAADTLVNPTLNNTTGAEIRLSGPLTAAAGVTVTVGSASSTPLTMAVIDGTSPGFVGTWAVTNSTLTQAAGVNPLGRAAVTTTGGLSTFTVGTNAASGLADAGGTVQLRAVSGTGSFQVGTTASASTAAVGFGDGDFAITGTGTLSAANAGSHFAKVGAGTFTHSGAQAAFNGSVSVRDGLFNLSGSSGTTGGFGSASSGPIAVYGGAELRETITGTGTNGRIGNTTAVTLNGGTLRMDGSGLGTTGTGYSEILGALNVGAGQSTVRIDTSANRGARFNFASLAQAANTGTVLFQSGNLGTTSFDTAGAGNVNFGTAPTLVGGIIPYGLAAASATGAPVTFATYDGGTDSVRGLATYAAALGTATDNVSLGSAATVGAATTANAVRLTAGGGITANAALTITSGALLNDGGGNVTGAGPLTFGAGGASTAYITANGAMTIGTPIAATNLSKNGAGTLSLTGAVTLGAGASDGVVAVNAGQLALNGATFTNARVFQVARGATLAPSAGLTLGTGQTLTGAGTVSGSVTAGTGSAVTPSALGGPDATLASPATLAVGNMTFQGGGSYRVYLNSVLPGRETQSTIAVAGTLNLSDPNLTSNPFTIRLDALALSNANLTTPVYDFSVSQAYSWTVLTTTGGITGFAANKFTLDTSDFAVPNIGTFALVQAGNDLVVMYTPVPEPGTVLGVATLVLVAGRAVRRRRADPAAVGGR